MPSAAFTSSATMRTRSPCLRTVPSRSVLTPSFSPIAFGSSCLSLKRNEELRPMTFSPLICARAAISSSESPIREIFVLRVATFVKQWQNCDRLLRNSRNRFAAGRAGTARSRVLRLRVSSGVAPEEKEAERERGGNHNKRHPNSAARTLARSIGIFGPPNSFRCELEGPGDNQRNRKADRDGENDQPNRPVWNFQKRKNLCGNLNQKPTNNRV